ncbi:NACHT domain- and WD repeat-containing protein 1-like [Mizuhopecten yessoensis]|uniref:NACHT and WD repeat domain-containing protein 1 n=1 Tax=Mizuhopecten yessoensis TaxID=6573 RepID=A0A210Q6F6_MIZYE|nr:NACHT domain- and WD repeat-containing protein 1-like [Mizuhopecten yessoensis]OWF44316.1 NACHT and WD repeat domain-containing protein 1 [Mizuhopecten yessoensis]
MGSGGSKTAPPKGTVDTRVRANGPSTSPKHNKTPLPKPDSKTSPNNTPTNSKTTPIKDSTKTDSQTTANNKTGETTSPEMANTKTKAPLTKSKSKLKFQRGVSKTLMKMTGEKTVPSVNLTRTSSSPILNGDVSIEVPSTSKIVRIFTSSTFTDTMHERNTWMTEAYPKLRSYCQSRGYEFQVVDMRWGIREDASDDHTTFDLCMTELKLCQQLSTGPNFISLLANKYGYRSPPRTIAVDEFQILLGGVENEEIKALLTKWYLRDDNAVPPEYVLQPISKYIPNRLSSDTALQSTAKDEWNDDECDMQDALEASARAKLPKEEAEKYYVSITEKEIQKGMLDVTNPEPSCLWFWRKIDDIENIDPTKHKTLRRYIDLSGEEEYWQESRRLLHTLEETKMKSHLPAENIHQTIVQWTDKGIDPDYAEHKKYLKTMTEDFIKEMVRLIDLGIKQRSAKELTDPLMLECCQHIRFCQQKCENFCGRQASLEKIKTYIKSTTTKPLIIHGASGCGKTSLMAMTARNVRSWMPDTQPAVVIRFIGTTLDSSNISGLLLSVICQIKAIYNQESRNPESLQELAKELDYVLSFAKSAQPLVVLLDSLDQIDISHNARSLFWLPRTLGKHVKLIVSTLEDEEFECFPKLKAMFKDEEDFWLVPELKPIDAEGIIQQWLKSRNRTLTPTQLTLLNASVYHCPLPLFLKLSFDSAHRWNSYMDKRETVLQKTIRSSIDTLFSKLETSHGQIFVSRTLGYLTASRNGLSESELEDVLSCDDDVLNDVYQFWVPPVRRLPPLLLVRLKAEIQQYIVERGSDGIRVLYWYHRQFIEAARARYCKSNVSVNINKGLADFFCGKWADGKKKPYVDKKKKSGEGDRHVSSQPLRHGDTYNLRRLNNAPYHRAQVNVVDLKNECLLNFEFLQAKVVASSVRHILDDFAFARKLYPKDRDLETVGAAFEMSQGALLYDPLQLAPQLMDRLAGEQLTIDLLGQCKQCNVPFFAPDQEVLMKPGGQLIYCLTGHQGPVLSVAIRQDGKVAVSCSDDDEDSVKTWDLTEGKLLKSYDGIKLNPSQVRYVCNDKYILVDYDDDYIAIQESGEVAFSIDNIGGQSAVGGKNNTLLATFCDDTVDVYNVENGECVSTVEVSQSQLAFSLGMPSAIAASENYVVLTDTDQHYFTVYNYPKRTLSNWVQVFSSERVSGQPDLTIDAIVIMPDETRFILSNVRDNDLHIYDIKSLNRLKTIKGFRMDFAQNYRITATGNFLYFPSESEVVVWNLKKEQRSGILPHPVPLRDVISWGWKTMVTATDDTTVRVWDLERKEKETKNQSVVLGHVIRHFIPMNNPRYAVVMAQTDRTDTESVCLQVYDIQTKKVVREGTPNVPPGVIKIVNDKQIAVVTGSRKIKTINLDTMTVDKVFEGDVSAYTVDIQVKSDGSEILTHTRGRQQFKIYNATTGKTKAIIKRPSNVKKDKKSPFEELFYVNKDWTVLAGRISVGPWLVYDLSTLQCIKSISPNEYNFSDIPIQKTALSEDGQTLVFGVKSHIESPGSTKEKYQLTSFAIWSTKENRRIASCEDIEYQNHYFEIVNRKGVDVSVDEIHVLDANRLLTVHDDFILRVWDRNTGELLKRLEGHQSAVQVFMKEDGPYFFSYATYEEENAIRVWDISKLECIASYRLDQTVVSTRVCSDGKQFITSTKSPTARLIHWRVEGLYNSTNLSSCPMLYKGTASNPNLALVVDDDDLIDENDLDTDEEESDEDD